LRSTATRASRSMLNPVLGGLTADRHYDLRNTILVAGWARSGTTWLAEVLSAIPRSAILFEPFYTERVPQAAAAGFPPTDILAPGEGTPSQKLFMERVLQGRILNWWTCSCTPIDRAIRPDVWIVKEIRANYLLEWILGTFPIRRAVLIVRHPCATVASRMAQGWAPNNDRSKVKQYAALRKFPHLAALCQDLTDPFEVMAARWCIMNYVPLSLQPRRFHVVAYESLATRGVEALVPLFADWGLEMPAVMEKSLGRASATTKAGSMEGTVHRQPIDQWRRKLTADQITRILRVVRVFGMDFYTEDSEPDYDRLSRTMSSEPSFSGRG
jgi:hypothetical protein